jgi:DNA polymerase III alpha subunit (gram-positive type)
LRPADYGETFYRELQPISNEFQSEALRVNGLDRDRLIQDGVTPSEAMRQAAHWVKRLAGAGRPVLVAYPLSFDWNFLYWYFVRFSPENSPFDYSSCFDIKTAFAVKAGIPIASAGRSKLIPNLRVNSHHTHNALEDAIEQAQVFANLFEWKGKHGNGN